MGGGRRLMPGGGAPWAAVWSTRMTALYHCCGPAFDTIRPGGPTRTSADASVPRLAGFSLIT